ncbi:hypothetical protein LY76DRAFT_218254 [Colletotrichum caudatum]|nr:hypothetical protein LY76DRAFT_218254 [Colletotrichum caudatum]
MMLYWREAEMEQYISRAGRRLGPAAESRSKHVGRGPRLYDDLFHYRGEQVAPSSSVLHSEWSCTWLYLGWNPRFSGFFLLLFYYYRPFLHRVGYARPVGIHACRQAGRQ